MCSGGLQSALRYPSSDNEAVSSESASLLFSQNGKPKWNALRYLGVHVVLFGYGKGENRQAQREGGIPTELFIKNFR